MMNRPTAEWVTAISIFVSMIAVVALIFITYKTVGEWRQTKRYDAFGSYYEKLENQKEATYDILNLITTMENAKKEYKESSEFLNIFKNELRLAHQDFMKITTSGNSELFIFYMNKPTIEAVKEMQEAEMDLNNSLKPIPELTDSKDIPYSEIEENVQKVIDATDNVILESVKSIKSKNAPTL